MSRNARKAIITNRNVGMVELHLDKNKIICGTSIKMFKIVVYYRNYIVRFHKHCDDGTAKVPNKSEKKI